MTETLPGYPIPTGFTPSKWRPSPEATQRVMNKIDSVDAARLHAAKHSHTAIIG